MATTDPAAPKAPLPWFGGKSRAARLIWRRFGDTPNYVEPFAGNLAVLLNRPHPPGTETVNDTDCYLANFWRAVKSDTAAVSGWASWPVNEADLHARHSWLAGRAEFRERMMTDPDFYDAKIAGWWVWGLCAWIGSGWCSKTKRPSLGDAGRGASLLAYFEALSSRLDRVRVCCGGWDRVLGPSVTTKHGLTAVLLDPPYGGDAGRAGELYASDDPAVAKAAREWALAHGDDPMLRVALRGYDGEHEMPGSWECVAWKARGGYGSQGDGTGRENAKRERVWFSPHCLKPERDRTLFDLFEAEVPS